MVFLLGTPARLIHAGALRVDPRGGPPSRETSFPGTRGLTGQRTPPGHCGLRCPRGCLPADHASRVRGTPGPAGPTVAPGHGTGDDLSASGAVPPGSGGRGACQVIMTGQHLVALFPRSAAESAERVLTRGGSTVPTMGRGVQCGEVVGEVGGTRFRALGAHKGGQHDRLSPHFPRDSSFPPHSTTLCLLDPSCFFSPPRTGHTLRHRPSTTTHLQRWHPGRARRGRGRRRRWRPTPPRRISG